MTDLRREAIDRHCTVRLDGCNTEPCCLAHYRVIGVSGMGLKPPDIIGAWACFACHEQLDRRAFKHQTQRYLTTEEIDAAFGRGMARTLKMLYIEEKITW